jgi:hypothetical protein
VSIDIHIAMAEVRAVANDTIYWGTSAMAYLSFRSEQREHEVDMMILVQMRDAKIVGYRWIGEPLE